jgi:hypothetical protein
VQTRGLGERVVVSARYRKDEQALGAATTVTSLRFVPYEDQGYGAYRKLLNQAATSEGAKR